MSSCDKRSRRLQIPATILLSIVLAVSPCIGRRTRVLAQGQASAGNISPREALARDADLSSTSAIATGQGVRLEWRTNFEQDNLGFDIYRVRDGQRVRVNPTIVPGSVFTVGQGMLRAGNSYQYLDPNGTVDSVYYIESQSSSGKRRLYNIAIPVSRGKVVAARQPLEGLNVVSSDGQPGNPQSLKEYPSSLARVESAAGQIESQWLVAAQSALKIQVNHDGWYRVTQEQMSAAGFPPAVNGIPPAVNIDTLSLFADGQEIAIHTSKALGQFLGGDYFEFYGRGLDTPGTDSRTYYLIAGAQPGKRLVGNFQSEDSVVEPPLAQPVNGPTQLTSATDSASRTDFTYQGWFAPLVNFSSGEKAAPSVAREAAASAKNQDESLNNDAVPLARVAENQPVAPASMAPETRHDGFRKPPASESEQEGAIASSSASSTASRAAASRPVTKRMRLPKARKRVKASKRRYSHAPEQAAGSTLSFNYTVQLKERLFYLTTLLNGESENYFGHVVGNDPVTETLPVHNMVSSAGSAQLVVALQGIESSVPSHQVTIFVNDVMVGTMSFFGLQHAVQTFTIPGWQLREGNNSVKLLHGASGDVSLVDYLTLNYPHSYRVDSTVPQLRAEAILVKNSLRFSLDSSQSATVAGFSKPSVRLLDVTDPTNVKSTRLTALPVGSEYAITVPADSSTSGLRNLYALLEWQFETPAGLSLNQPSTLNSNSGADLLIIAHKSFIPSLAPLVLQRQQVQGLTVVVADIDDVYDEFSFGAHGPQAIKDLLAHALAHWAKPPRYLLLVGDASYDPRNYEGQGFLDFVPSKLVDTVFGETCSDDSLADLDGDGIPELAVGRLPVKTVAEANAAVAKIVGFSLASVPKAAMLVADTQGSYYFSFEQANDEVQVLLPSSITVQKVYRNLQPSDTAARNNIISQFNSGLALVNYAGHGNVDVWTGGAIFTSTDALALTNGNRLPFVVVMDCLNGRFDIPGFNGMGEAFMNAPNGGAIAAWASSGLTVPEGQRDMSLKMYQLVYGAQPIALGDAVRQAKTATADVDVRRTWILFGDPTMRIW